MIPTRLQRAKEKANFERSPKAVGYLRVSTDDQTHNESLKTQRERIEKYAHDNGLEIVRWFSDEGISGKTVSEREQLKALLHYLSRNKGKVGYVIFYKMWRASRHVTTYSAELKTVLNAYGVAVRSATEYIDDTPSGHFMESMFVASGQLDNEVKSGATTDNMHNVAKQGWWQGGAIPGYITVKVKIDPKKTHTTLKRNHHAKAVNMLFEEFATGQYTKADIVRLAKENKVRNSHGGWLNDTSVDRMLSQPAYPGYVCNKLTDFEMYEGKHMPEAIVSLNLFNRVQKVLEQQSKRVNKLGKLKLAVNPLYPLKKTLQCYNCGNAYRGSAPRTGGGKSHSARYHCPRKECLGIVKSMMADKVHEHFVSILADITPSEDVLKLYKEILNRQALKQLGSINKRLETQRNQLAQLDNERLEALRNANNGQLTANEKDDLIAALTLDKDDAKENIAKLEEQQLVKQAAIEYALNFMHYVKQLWIDASPELKQRFQKMIFPEGLSFNTSTLTFGTEHISPLYRYVPNKKDLSDSEKSSLVSQQRIEP